MAAAAIEKRREDAGRRGVRGSEKVLAVEPFVMAGDDMEVGVRFSRESWKRRDTHFQAERAYCFPPMAFASVEGVLQETDVPADQFLEEIEERGIKIDYAME